MAAKQKTGRKICSVCGLDRPARDYHGNRDAPDGLRAECRFCSKEARQAAQEKSRIERVSSVEQRLLEALDALVKSSGVAPKDVPHLTETLESIFSAIGGAPGFTMIWLEQLQHTKPGSPQRMKLLEQLVRMQTKASEEGYIDQPLADKDDEELRERRRKTIQELAAEAGLRVVDDDSESDSGTAAAAG